MARIDPAIHRLLSQEGIELFFRSGGMPVLRTPTSTSQVLPQPLESAQIVSAFAETVPEHLRSQFPVEGTTRWVYSAPSGRVRIQFSKRAERVSVSVRPLNGEDVELEVENEEHLALVAPLNAAKALPPTHTEGPSMPIPKRLETRPMAVKAEPAICLPSELTSQSELRIAEPPPELISAKDAAGAMNRLLKRMLARGASDLHLSSGATPMLRIDGRMQTEPGWPTLSHELLHAMLWSITGEGDRATWASEHDVDFAHETEEGRFRVNLFRDRHGLGAVLRHIPGTIKSADALGLPASVKELCSLSNGIVLVTGPTGSGKSTTLAALIDHVNRTRDDHIITIEDPIEFQHSNRRCLVNQREVGSHTRSFKQALRAALREDPDVVLVGELRDLETVSIALETAETGHLVFGTLHTNTAISTIDRIIDQFPADRQGQVRTVLSESLRAVVAQTLCRRIGGGRVAAYEILVANGAVSNLIREGKTFQLPSLMQTGRTQGMVTLNDSLLDLVKRNVVEPQEALAKAVNRSEFRGILERSGFKLEPKATPPAPSEAAAPAPQEAPNPVAHIRKCG